TSSSAICALAASRSWHASTASSITRAAWRRSCATWRCTAAPPSRPTTAWPGSTTGCEAPIAGAAGNGADRMNGFAPFGLTHLLMVCVCALLLAAVALLGPRLRSRPAEWRARLMLAIFALLYWVAYNTWWNWGGLDLRTGLPLQSCDISGL